MDNKNEHLRNVPIPDPTDNSSWGTDENLDGKDPELTKSCDPIRKTWPEGSKEEQISSVPMSPEELSKDAYFSKVFSKPENPMKDLDPLLSEKVSECDAKNQKRELTKKLSTNFKKMADTQEFKRIHEISIRVDTNEKTIIEEKAKSNGFRSTSEYVRFVAQNSYLIAGVESFTDKTKNEITYSTTNAITTKARIMFGGEEDGEIFSTKEGGKLSIIEGNLIYTSSSGNQTILANN